MVRERSERRWARVGQRRARSQRREAHLTALWSVESLTHGYHTGPPWRRTRRDALVDVSIDVHAGERLGVLGASGSGKSTLLRVGLGLERRQSGVVRFRGSDTSDWSGARWQRARSEIQLLLQDPMAMLHPTLPIGYLVEESARLHRPHAPAARVAREALVHVGLADRWWATPSELSGGERRRASLARVLVAQPALLCVDEPTNGIDAARRPAVVRRLLDAIPVDGALVMVSHDVELLRWACQRFIVLDAGRIVDAFTRAMLDTLGPAARAPATQRLLGGHA